MTAIGGSSICNLLLEDSRFGVSRVISLTRPWTCASATRAGSRRPIRAAIHPLHPRGRNTREGHRRGFTNPSIGVQRRLS